MKLGIHQGQIANVCACRPNGSNTNIGKQFLVPDLAFFSLAASHVLSPEKKSNGIVMEVNFKAQ